MIRIGRMLSTGISVRRGLQEPAVDELVSIIVPAHNEERVIATCLDSLLAQKWDRLQVIVVADRCSDATEAIVAERVERDDRLTLIRNTDCPESWAGKCHALRIGAEHAEGDMLAFIDADTEAHPDLLRAAVGEAKRRDTALLSLLTDLKSCHWFERCTQPVATMALMSLFPPDRVNRDDRARTFANGQFMLFDRDWYDQVGGHAAVKDDLLEDIAFARIIRDAGGRVNILQADGLLSCSMYGSREEFLRGWMRIFLEATNRGCKALRKQARRQLLVGWAVPGVCVIAVVFGLMSPGLEATIALVLGVLGLLSQLMALAWIYSIGRQPMWSVLLFPIGTWEVFRIMRWAERTLQRGETVKWGGREYVLKPRGDR
jgi:chlorobactene glucosyltransferase